MVENKKPRTLVNLIGAPLLLSIIYLGGPLFTMFIFVVIFISTYEFDNMIKIKLQDLTSFYAEEIKQKKTKNMVPLYYYRDILLTKSCSISHHGKYGVFSLLYS